MHENEIATAVVDCALKVHKALGPGLLESVYRSALAYELRKLGYRVEIEKKIPGRYEDVYLNLVFYADILIEKKVIVETKSIDAIHPIHPMVLLTYLRMADLRLGILINFKTELLKHGLKRVVNNL